MDVAFADLHKAKSHMSRLAANLPVHVTSMSFSAYQLLQMVAINLFALYHAKRRLKTNQSQSLNGKDEGEKESGQKDDVNVDARRCYDMPFELTGKLTGFPQSCWPCHLTLLNNNIDLYLAHTPEIQINALCNKNMHTQ